MSILGLIGIILGFFAIPVAFTQATRLKVAYMAIIYLIHIAACLVYFKRAEGGAADSALYYDDPYQTYQDGFGLGTQGILYVVQYLREMVGGTYLDFYLLFQAIGFLGLTILLRILEEVHDELRIPYAPYFYALIALPSLHFWSSALGKDAPMLLATSLALWASMRLPNRAKALIGALLLMLFIRPHIAVVATAALSLAVVVGRGIPIYLRIVLFFVAVAGTGLAATTLQNTYAIDITSSESIGQQFERRDNVLQSDEAGNTAVTGGVAVRLLSLLFRPFFFDANELFALLASFENLVVLGIFLLLLVRWRNALQLFRNVFFTRFALIYAVALTVFLTLSYWNVGLGLRQKWTMLMPMYLVLLVAVMAVRQARKQSMAEAESMEWILAHPSPDPRQQPVQAPLAPHRG